LKVAGLIMGEVKIRGGAAENSSVSGKVSVGKVPSRRAQVKRRISLKEDVPVP
jgi:hypothetical protein